MEGVPMISTICSTSPPIAPPRKCRGTTATPPMYRFLRFGSTAAPQTRKSPKNTLADAIRRAAGSTAPVTLREPNSAFRSTVAKLASK